METFLTRHDSTSDQSIQTLIPNLACAATVYTMIERGRPGRTSRLSAALQGSEIVISWNTPSGFQLQSRSDLGQGTWTDETTPAVVNGDQTTVRLPAIGPARFFRLVSR